MSELVLDHRFLDVNFLKYLGVHWWVSEVHFAEYGALGQPLICLKAKCQIVLYVLWVSPSVQKLSVANERPIPQVYVAVSVGSSHVH